MIGYDPNFIGNGIVVPAPTLSNELLPFVAQSPQLRDGVFSDHIYFSLVLNNQTRQVVFSACNIDQSKFGDNLPKDTGKKGWTLDPNLSGSSLSSFQLRDKYYKDRTLDDGSKIFNPYDKGHMVMRNNNMWGDSVSEIDKAGEATFIFSNASLQHENLNRDEWKYLEMEIVRKFSNDANDRFCIFTGPIYGNLDRHVHLTDVDSARVPSGFFKVICFQTKDDFPDRKLGVLSFAIFQDENVLADNDSGATLKTNRAYQVTIMELQRMTGLRFDDEIVNRNPLVYLNDTLVEEQLDQVANVRTVPERIPFNNINNVIPEHSDSRVTECNISERQIAISAAMIDPVEGARLGEWIALTNLVSESIDLSRWSLVDQRDRTLKLEGILNSGETLTIRGSDLSPVRLTNDEGSLMLFDEHDCRIDHVTWSRAQMRSKERGRAFLFDNVFN